MNDIYREDLMEHYKNPQNRGKLESPDVEVVKKNPMCGDIITMQANIRHGKLEDIMFDGEACAVCVASASILTDENKHKPLNDIKKYSKEDLLQNLGVNLTTSRIKCATLPLEALQNLVNNYEQAKS